MTSLQTCSAYCNTNLSTTRCIHNFKWCGVLKGRLYATRQEAACGRGRLRIGEPRSPFVPSGMAVEHCGPVPSSSTSSTWEIGTTYNETVLYSAVLFFATTSATYCE
ncbi:uncharacterized protein LOC143149393 [Ptiloglossa arizonensis]|uniref:uncharacterized protein LOC143149393 n=1 Tax=Ptiloglossa arizonensis TaxID=3350558 RepID=UPI003FA0B9C1